MTVNELIQKLIELARDGKGQHKICVWNGAERYRDYAVEIWCDSKKEEVIVE